MSDEGQEPGDSFEDLFEDLDKFFAPGDPGETARRGARSPDAEPSDPSDVAEPTEPAESAIGMEEDLLPPGWEPDVSGLEVPSVAVGEPTGPEQRPEEPPPLPGDAEDIEPVSADPGDDQPYADRPDTDQPDMGEPAIAEPVIEEPGIVEPGIGEPGFAEDQAAAFAEAEAAGAAAPEWSAQYEADAEAARLGAASSPESDPPTAQDEPATPYEPATPDEPTSEFSGDEWSRLRDVLGDEGEARNEDDIILGGTPVPGGGPELFPYAADDASWDEPEERHELTLDDLKKAPPEYADLPRSDEEPVEDLSEREMGAGRSELADAPPWDDPAIAEVEAAADHLAEEFGDGTSPEGVEEDLLADLDRPRGPRTVKVGEPERMSGPTWEEPGSQVITSEPTAPRMIGGRNLPAAVLTGLALGAAALIALWFSKAAFAVVAGAVVLLGQAELYATMHRRGHQPATALGLALGGFTLAGAYLKGEPAMTFFLVLGVLLSFMWYMVAAPKSREGVLQNVGSTIVGVLYVPFLASFIFIILAQPASGRAVMLAVLGLTVLYDVSAFAIGSLWGSRALAPSISPKKSWEGLFGATVVVFIVGVAALPSIDPLGPLKAVGLALVVSAFAPLGDLIESMIKRDLGVKDMGSVLPGHGGILDRIDSLLLVAPAALYFLRLVS